MSLIGLFPVIISLNGQEFGPRVRPFIETEASVIAFTNAVVIDGTGFNSEKIFEATKGMVGVH